MWVIQYSALTWYSENYMYMCLYLRNMLHNLHTHLTSPRLTSPHLASRLSRRLDRRNPLRDTFLHTWPLVQLPVPLRNPRKLLLPIPQPRELQVEDPVPHHERYVRVRGPTADEPLLIIVRELLLENRQDPSGLFDVALYGAFVLLLVRS